VRHVVDECWANVRDTMEYSGFTVAGDDRAEKLVVAIYRFVVDSMGGDR
jgi:hypothetical protein